MLGGWELGLGVSKSIDAAAVSASKRKKVVDDLDPDPDPRAQARDERRKGIRKRETETLLHAMISSSSNTINIHRLGEKMKEEMKSMYFWGDTPEEEYYKSQGARGSKSLYNSPRSGLSLFTRSCQPLSSPPRAIICMVHGYGNDISWTFQSTPIFLARMGFACFALDLQGHGLSQGLKAFVPDVYLLVEDCRSFFNSIKPDPQFRGLPCFLYGESMGGAICLLIHFKDSEGAWNGAILVAPICKISDNVRARWPLPQLLTFLSNFFPTLPIVPTAHLLEKSVKVPVSNWRNCCRLWVPTMCSQPC